MPDTLSIEFQITRDDWLALNRATMAESPEWAEFARKRKRRIMKEAWPVIPGLAIIGALLLPRLSGFQDAAILGGIGGAIFGAFSFWGLTRINTVDQLKKAYLKQIEQVDLSAYVGPHTVRVTADAVHIVAPARELKLRWTTARPSRVTNYLIIYHGAHDATIIPTKAFPSDTDANAFFDQIVRWHHDAQGPESERLARYLADRDLPCPKCRYNLRGTRAQSCPECGASFTVESLMNTKRDTCVE